MSRVGRADCVCACARIWYPTKLLSSQRWRSRRRHVSVSGRCRYMFEGVRHSDEFGVVPRATQELEVDLLLVIGKSGGKDNRRNTVGRARRISPTEARPSATTIVHADLA